MGPGFVALLSSFIFGIWFIFSYQILFKKSSKRAKTKIKKRKDVFELIGIETVAEEAKKAGWKITKKEFGFILGFAIASTLMLSVLFKNYFILLGGFVVAFYIPKYLLAKFKYNKMLKIINSLPGAFRMIISRLPDQRNVTRAIEIVRDETTDPLIKPLLDAYIMDVSAGASVDTALYNMKAKIQVKKFDDILDYFSMAHSEGCTKEALNALDKSVEALETDLRAIKKVREGAKKKKIGLYRFTALCWSFPGMLSMMSTAGEPNLYLNTLPGKLLMFAFFIGTLYVIVKSDEYLNLNLEEL